MGGPGAHLLGPQGRRALSCAAAGPMLQALGGALRAGCQRVLRGRDGARRGQALLRSGLTAPGRRHAP